ncbi:Dynamin-binding protein-like [Homarus americanus]|uniref:Dynamin-binding protein-like n=1 Tax=Homarus americanus TaxID=6706 RepID=A0A8J5N9C5_HOMAM|nr:Dynamin-binding protein-like [Homarus americanus]
MKAGDVCRCITDFSGVLEDEITVYKNDMVQIHSVVDRHWLEAQGGGSVGRVPSSVLVKTEIPPHPPHLPLFVASAEFMPSQPGDLGMARGDFIIGLNPIDESWWCGEINGKKGIFPLNFVWRINKDIIEVEDTAEKPVRMKGKVNMSIRAQFPEELDLYAGDIVNITHVVDKDWYRGESNGATGTFPSSFVDIIEETSVPFSSAVYPDESNHVASSSTAEPGLSVDCVLQENTYINDTPSLSTPEAPVPSVEDVTPAKDHSTFSSNVGSTASPSQSGQIFDEPVILSKTSSRWKTVESDDNADIFEDDYFKQNMPGVFSSSSGTGNVSLNNASSFTTPSISQASASPSSPNQSLRYGNIPEPSVLPDKSYHDKLLFPNGVSQFSDTDLQNRSDVKHRYESILQDNTDSSKSGYIQSITDDAGVLGNDPEPSAFTSVQEIRDDSVLNSLSQKVDDYFSKNLLEESGKSKALPANNNHLIKDYNSLSSPGYNEDNTGIEPYGRALFSFRAQYPNELTFRKGDIIHLLKHVDSHWTLGRVGDSKGIFPTSYVDIIVDCLHNEEELFLARPAAILQATHLGHAKAMYSFQAVESGDVSMMKGDILKILKYVDNNWVIVENMTGSRGMCPQNYLSIQVEESPDVSKELDTQQMNLGPGADTERESRLPVQDAVHDRSRSTSPFSTSGKRRSYNKADFGSIKKQDVEPVLAKNVASLDVTLRCSQVVQFDKKGSESIFTEREDNPETSDQPIAREGSLKFSPAAAIPSKLNKISMLSTDTSMLAGFQDSEKESTQVTQPYAATMSSVAGRIHKTSTSTTPTTSQPPVASPRSVNIPQIPPRKKISRSYSSESNTCPTNTVATINVETETEGAAAVAKPLQEVQKPSKPSKHRDSLEPVYAQVQKPRLTVKPSKIVRQKKIEESEVPKASVTRGESAAFPDDVSHISSDSEGTYSTEINNGSSSPALAPQRPAPPPPPKAFDMFYDESEMVSLQDTAPSSSRMRAESVRSAGGADNTNVSVTEGAQSDEASALDVEAKAKVRANQRLELVKEIVTTEHEYIHDLEALIQVISLAPSQKESQSVNLNTIMGNICQVVEVAKKFLSVLDKVAFETEEELLVGRVFLLCADELCEVYKVYCSNHNIAAEPLLKKYVEEPEPAAFLHWVLGELQQQKIQLMDMRSVLIKPVQRVLKYPLFLDRLVSETPRGHPDYTDLIEAKTKMANVAKEINDYTKRLDLVNKYRFESDQSLHSKMQRVSLHSVAKKSARISTLVSEMLGIMNQTKDPDFDEEVAKFRSMQKAAAAMTMNVGVVVQSIKARHKAELEIAKGLVATLHQVARTPEIEAIQKTASDSCNRLFEMFDNFVKHRVIMVVKQLLCLCEVPERLIMKRNDKLLDYDNAQYKLDRNRDLTRTRILEEELSQAKGTYEALNMQLMMELPVLINCGTEVMVLATRSFVAARMYLQGHLAQQYLRLAQVPGLAYAGEEDMLAQFRIKYLQQMGEFRQLSFIPVDSLQRSLPRPKPRGRKSQENPSVKKDAPESVKKKVLGSYPVELIYVVTEVHTPAEVMELTLYPGDHVALLKNKDPLGRAAFLRPLQGQENRMGVVTALPSATSHTVTPTLPVPAPTPRPSTLPRAAPSPPIPERPPRYEDLFPTSTSCGPSQFTSFSAQGQQAPPPRYSPGQAPQSSLKQAPLPSKPGYHEQMPSTSLHDSQVSESVYYSPPLDRQQSHEYNSPVSEDTNIYEEIDQGTVNSVADQEEEGRDSSPIYEVIEDGQLVQDSGGMNIDMQADLPGLAPEEPQFYFALYNFGGSDATQLNLVAGQVVLVLHAKSSDWWFVEDRNGNQGYVPASYLTSYT